MLRYNFRVYPNARQRHALARTFGCARVVYNDALALRAAAFAAGQPLILDVDLSKQVITQAKRTPERAFLSEAPAAVLQQSLADFCTAYRAFLASLSGRRPGPPVGMPGFKTRKDVRQSVRYTRNTHFRILPNGKLRLPKIGHLKVRWSRKLPSDPSSVTITVDSAGRYHASFVVQTDPSEVLPEVESEVGIDLGLAHFATLSDGTKVTSPRFLRAAEKKLRSAHRNMSRKQKGSRNRAKARVRLAKVHARVSDARRNHHHQLSTKLIRENQAVYVESLAIRALSRSRLGKSVRDAGWAQFLAMLEYKAARYGRTVVRTKRDFPSSQICSACGFRDGPKPLRVRDWACSNCGIHHDRDLNAAQNILQEGKKMVAAERSETKNACGAQVSPVLVPAPRSEAGTRRSAQAQSDLALPG